MFFRELLVMLAAVATTTSSDALRPIAEEILQPVALETGLQQDSAGLHTACRYQPIPVCLSASLCPTSSNGGGCATQDCDAED